MRYGPAAIVASLIAWASPALGDASYVVQKGDTLAGVARSHHVSVAALARANHIRESSQPRAGQALVIPSAGPNAFQRTAERGSILAERFGETVHIRVRDPRGRILESALKAFQNMMRQGAASFPVDPRLLALVSAASDHFGGRTLEIVSGYRTDTPAQYLRHSNHDLGRAIDFRIDGVKNEDIWTFCLSLQRVGCGYYPNSGFVHLDVRETKASWIDRSLPGEPPQYDAPEELAVKSIHEPADSL